ncbi:hypothetical protein NAEGRDRAFT_77810 [Naegleria gruberi]|uniref:Uncharacterized protein n=1 Tax=Naegleria gruberi TaxID=5762 RepID=D2UYM3_NAEGR|nr:uncharacterized protein NAEGRDRAFT_77810 [Naegleria gruberi]EFC50820.1 hypothetical protein NAEGRDRAFT_77810 [Naegleria gruberi]|eukprot:XP_002683564.1 hypothetical protein NAEGRDRAFT_77810 [Naegleria gruberi strain NEG-M]
MSQQQQSLLRDHNDDDDDQYIKTVPNDDSTSHHSNHYNMPSSNPTTSTTPSSISNMMENSILSILLALFFLFMGALNIIQYIIFFARTTILLNTLDEQLYLAYSITDMVFYATMVVMSLFLLVSVAAASKGRWKLHLFSILIYTILFVMAMILSIGSMTLSIVVIARKGDVGFAIVRTIMLAVMFLLFCAVVNCLFLPAKFRQSTRGASRVHGDYSML